MKDAMLSLGLGSLVVGVIGISISVGSMLKLTIFIIRLSYNHNPLLTYILIPIKPAKILI